jgi:flagellar basal-body rod protein FlgC
MAGFQDTLSVAASGMEAQARRLRTVSENIANADTPGFRRKVQTFRTEPGADGAGGQVRAGEVTLDRARLRRVYDPANPLADATGFYDGSNVDIVIELADAREAQRSYEANLKVFDQTRQMAQGLLELLRR